MSVVIIIFHNGVCALGGCGLSDPVRSANLTARPSQRPTALALIPLLLSIRTDLASHFKMRTPRPPFARSAAARLLVSSPPHTPHARRAHVPECGSPIPFTAVAFGGGCQQRPPSLCFGRGQHARTGLTTDRPRRASVSCPPAARSAPSTINPRDGSRPHHDYRRLRRQQDRRG